MSPEQYKIALCQLQVTPDKDGNIARARTRIETAAAAGAKLVVLPASPPSPTSSSATTLLSIGERS